MPVGVQALFSDYPHLFRYEANCIHLPSASWEFVISTRAITGDFCQYEVCRVRVLLMMLVLALLQEKIFHAAGNMESKLRHTFVDLCPSKIAVLF